MLLTASRLDEPAYEHPHRRHGLLTAALLDAFTSGQHTGVLSLVESVIERVRVDALAMGVTQHPVATTYVDGGFLLPVFHRGARFAAAFPESAAVTVAGLADISAFGIPSEVIEEWRQRFGDHLHDLQLTAINDYRVLEGDSVFVLAPTSSGKTFVGELAAVRAVVSGRKAVFLLPYKALVNEKYDDFEALYGQRLGMRVIRCTGDRHDQVPQLLSGRFDIAFLTYEMFLGLIVGQRWLLNLLGLIVLDEAQLITDESRGIHVELLLTLLRSARRVQVSPQLVLLSATVGDTNHFDEWLDIRTLRSDVRPVPLEFGVMDRNGMYQFVSADGTTGSRRFLLQPAHQRGPKPSSQDVIVPLVRQLVNEPATRESVIVFRNTRGSAEGCAGYLARELGLPPDSRAVAALPTGDLSSSSPRLRAALQGGTAFHTSNLNREERVVVEQAFRAKDGDVRVLAATSGLAAGINTPASTVIIAETRWASAAQDPMSVGTVRNMAGRAGRYGYRETGRAVIMAETGFERQQLFTRYVVGRVEPIVSSFKFSDLPTWVVRLLRQVEGIHRAEVATLLINTYGGYLQARREPGFAARVQAAVPPFLDRLNRSRLIAEDENGLHLTALGQACGQSTLGFESCLRVIEDLRNVRMVISPESILAVTESLPESDETYVPLQKKGSADYRWPSVAAGRLGTHVGTWFQRGADPRTVAARAKRTLIALDWSEGVPIERIEAAYSVNPFNAVAAGDIRSIAESARFRMRSVYEIAAIAFPESLAAPEAIEALFTQLEFGIPSAALDLLRLPIALTRHEYLELVAVHLTQPEAIWALTPEDLRGRISQALSEKLNSVKRP